MISKGLMTVEEYEREQLMRAVYYTATIRHAPGDVERVQCVSKEVAFAQADILDTRNHYGRKALCYAVTPEGNSIFLPRPARQTPPRQ